jgi:2-keto-4-pentenoate hydratase/2-oxohepta-3-ene-1,7-dioic acid hydratase in catechol pathway
MRLLRYLEKGVPKLGALTGTEIVSLDSLLPDYPTMISIIAGGDLALAAVRQAVADGQATLALADATLLAPIERPGKFMAIGMNYRKHIAEARELGFAEPTHQYWFNKQTSCLAGPYDATDRGRSEQLDYEVELCVVIGKPAKDVPARALLQKS